MKKGGEIPAGKTVRGCGQQVTEEERCARDLFRNEIFPAEIEEVRRRRRNADDERPLADAGKVTPPHTDNDLNGLAFSGGGIRSAAFCLGIVQQLIKKSLFKRLDYLSTVSGGGFLGACISSLMRGTKNSEKLLVEFNQGEEPPALEHLRNNSNYLLSPGALGGLTIPAVYFRGLFQCLLLFIPPIIFAVFITEALVEITSRTLPEGALTFLPGLGGVILLLAFLWQPVKLAGNKKNTWKQRDASYTRLSGLVGFAIICLIAMPTFYVVTFLINSAADDILGVFETENLILSGVVLGVVLLMATIFLRGKLVLMVARLIAPVILLLIYFICCVTLVNSPIRPINRDDITPANIRSQLSTLLKSKSINPEYYFWKGEPLTKQDSNDPVTTDEPFKLTRVGGPESLLPDFLTATRPKNISVNFEAGEFFFKKLKLLKNESHFYVQELAMLRGNTEWWFYLIGFLILLYADCFININKVSLHYFYRDRLSRTFLISASDDGSVSHKDRVLLDTLGGENSNAPYHLINATLNLQGSSNINIRQRNASSFLFSKLFSGSMYTGYCKTSKLNKVDPHLDLATAMAISGAAATPNTGVSNGSNLHFIMTMLNIRMSYWLRHPKLADKPKWWHRLIYPRPGLHYIMAEAFRKINANGNYLNLSDGAHYDNLAVYELLRRRCRFIINVDAGMDGEYRFSDLTRLQRFARIDLGTTIEFPNGALDAIKPSETGFSKKHYAIAIINYPDNQKGVYVYIKLSSTDTEPAYVRSYKSENPSFPHQSTSDQFFGETQFEVYRALGEYIVDTLMDEDPIKLLQKDGSIGHI